MDFTIKQNYQISLEPRRSKSHHGEHVWDVSVGMLTSYLSEYLHKYHISQTVQYYSLTQSYIEIIWLKYC